MAMRLATQDAPKFQFTYSAKVDAQMLTTQALFSFMGEKFLGTAVFLFVFDNY